MVSSSSVRWCCDCWGEWGGVRETMAAVLCWDVKKLENWLSQQERLVLTDAFFSVSHFLNVKIRFHD
jgi:hypothetical protein